MSKKRLLMEILHMKENRFFKWCTSNNTKTFWSCFIATFLLIVAIIGLLTIKYSLEIKDSFEWILITTLLICIITSLSSWLIRLYTTKYVIESQCDDDDILISDLIESLKKELEKNKYQEVITIGHILSKPLFIIGKHELRLEVGKLVKKAAVAQYARLRADNAAQERLNKYKEIEMIELIDSIGWMKIELGDANGRSDIENGRLIAESLNTDTGRFYESKAYRHFGAIARRENNWTDALAFNNKSLEKANEITEDQLKIEAIAGAYYARSFVFKGQNNYSEALSFLEQSLLEFEKISDNDKKTMKLCMVKEAKARFLLQSKQKENDYHNISTAKSIFEEALAVAEHNSLRLEMIRCYIGLAECDLHFTINNHIEAQRYIDKAKNVKIKYDEDQKRIKDIEYILLNKQQGR